MTQPRPPGIDPATPVSGCVPAAAPFHRFVPE